jgi:hypothetical protein
MKNHPHAKTLTIGELCAAIADGRLPATVEDNQWYQVNGRELRRFANRQKQRPERSAPGSLHLVER